MSPSFSVLGPSLPGPLVLEVPHAGLSLDTGDGPLVVPPHVLAADGPLADSDVGAARLCEGEPRARRVVAHVSRYVIDLNTAPRLPTDYEDKLPPGLGDVRVRSLAGVWWHAPRVSRATLEGRLSRLFEPYHEAVARELEASAARHGRALLLAVHTYPDGGRPGTPDAVLGTRRGEAASAELREHAAASLAAHGLSVSLEEPFPGGYSLARHARPPRVSAIQLELARRLVCAPGEPTRPQLDEARLARAAIVLRSLVTTLSDLLAGSPDA